MKKDTSLYAKATANARRNVNNRPHLLKEKEKKEHFTVIPLVEWTDELSVRNLEGTLHYAFNHCPRAFPDKKSDGSAMTTSVLWTTPDKGGRDGKAAYVLFLTYSTSIANHTDLEGRDMSKK